MMLPWKNSQRSQPKPSAPAAIQFDRVTLPPCIRELDLTIPQSSWVALSGEDECAKALFCDLCFGYLHPEAGSVRPAMKASDVSFLGRRQTTYGKTLLDHLTCGTQRLTREALHRVVRTALSDRFRRHVAPGRPWEFAKQRTTRELVEELDESDWMEIAEANLLLQGRPAAVIDTGTDFYRTAVAQGFRHTEELLSSPRMIFWLVNDEAEEIPADARPWNQARAEKLELTFPSGSRSGYIN